METLAVVLVLVTAAATAGITLAGVYRQQLRALKQLWDRDVDRLRETLTSREARIAELERQVDSMHSRGITTEPRPEPEEEPEALPVEILEHLDSIEDPQAVEEFAEVAAFELARGKPAEQVARELFIETKVEE